MSVERTTPHLVSGIRKESRNDFETGVRVAVVTIIMVAMALGARYTWRYFSIGDRLLEPVGRMAVELERMPLDRVRH